MAVTSPRRASARSVLVALLLAATLCALLSSWAGVRAGTLQGPSTLEVLPEGELCLLVGDALWRVSPEGRVLSQVTLAEAGLPRAPATLAYRERTRELYALARGGEQIEVLHPTRVRLTRTIALQWPESLSKELSGGLWLAVHDDGRLAVAVSAAHVVALFAADGAHLASTAPGTYRYTNELWWADEQLWTTDTNGHALVQLDGRSLAEQARHALRRDHPWRFTALAVPHPQAESGEAPKVTLARLDGRMRHGRLVQRWPDGREEALDFGDEVVEPVELAWHRHGLDGQAVDELLVVDAGSWRIRRFDVRRQPLADFGDAAFQAELQGLRAQQQRWQSLHTLGLFLGLGLLFISVGCLWWVKRAEPPRQVHLGADLSRLGTPVLSNWAMLRGQLSMRSGRAFAVFVPFLFLCLLRLGLVYWPDEMKRLYGLLGISGPSAALATLSAAFLLLLFCVAPLWVVYRLGKREAQRLQEPRWEGVANASALGLLRRWHRRLEVARPGEQVHETWMLRSWTRTQWCVLSNERLLVYQLPNVFQTKLKHSVARQDVRIDLLRYKDLPWRQRWRQLRMAGLMRIHLATGEVVEGSFESPVTVRRVQEQLTVRDPRWPAPLDDSTPSGVEFSKRG